MESIEIILNQMKDNICKIYNIDVGKGSGFFCIIEYDNIKIPTLITNRHVINEKYIEKYKQIAISLNNDKNNIIIKFDDKRKIYFSNKYDVAIIEIKKKIILIANIQNQMIIYIKKLKMNISQIIQYIVFHIKNGKKFVYLMVYQKLLKR